MKQRIIIFMCVLAVLRGAIPARAQQEFPRYEQERASLLAEEIARQKEWGGKNAGQDEGYDAQELIAQGYAHWANREFAPARIKFEEALRHDPGNERIMKMIHEVDIAYLDLEQRNAHRRRQVIQEERLLETGRAWLTEDISRQRRAPGVRRTSGEPLRDKALDTVVSLDFEDAQVRAVLSFLSDISGINIVVDDEAIVHSGAISIHLRNVNVVQALESILRSKGMTYRFESDFVWVSTPEALSREGLTTRIYHLSQGLATFTKFSTFDTVTIDAVRGDNDITVIQDGDVGLPDVAGKGVRTFEGVKIGGPGGVAGKITNTVEDVLRAIVEWPEGSRIFLDQRTSALIVRNTPTNLGIIEQALSVLDVNPPQVMIEARFVEVGAADLLDLGLKLTPTITATGAQRSHSFPFNRNESNKYVTPMADEIWYTLSDSAVKEIGSTTTPFDFSLGTLNFNQFQAVLSAIEEKTESNTLSSPKVTTVAGQEAIIKVVKEYRYPTKYEIITYEVGTGDNRRTFVTSVPAEFKTRDIGIILRVTPNVGADNKTINLTLIPEVSEFDITRDMFNYGTEDSPFLQPFFSVRNCTASIVVHNGDTVVLGGLMRETIEQTVTRVPLLGQMPLVGKLFTSKQDNKQKRNLLIFVTARLIAPTGQSIGE